MTDNIKHSTSYFHEAIAHAFEMFKNGYEPVMETPFQPRRLGSAFVTEYKPVRDVFDFTEIDNANEILDNPPKANERLQKLIEESKELFKGIAVDESCNLVEDFKPLDIEEKRQVDDLFAEIQQIMEYKAHNPDKSFSGVVEIEDKEGNSIKLPGIVGFKTTSRGLYNADDKGYEGDKQLTIQQKWEAEEALNELTAQSQELGMYEVDKEQVKVYSKSELENMEWVQFKKLIDAAGIRGRRRANLTRDYLIYQEEIMK